ncbi:hypothetical protein [Methanogenium cariaci]|jgi:hypothetical protein
MSKLVRSTIEPETLGIDVIKNGSVRLLCRWDIHTVEITDEESGTHDEYEYQEEVIWWALPSPVYLSRQGSRQVLTTEGLSYLTSAQPEIMDYAQAAGV